MGNKINIFNLMNKLAVILSRQLICEYCIQEINTDLCEPEIKKTQYFNNVFKLYIFKYIVTTIIISTNIIN